MSKKVSKDLARFYAKLTPSNLAEGEQEPPKGRKPETVTLDQFISWSKRQGRIRVSVVIFLSFIYPEYSYTY